MTEINQIINKLNAWCESKGLNIYKDTGYVYEKLETEEMILDSITTKMTRIVSVINS